MNTQKFQLSWFSGPDADEVNVLRRAVNFLMLLRQDNFLPWFMIGFTAGQRFSLAASDQAAQLPLGTTTRLLGTLTIKLPCI